MKVVQRGIDHHSGQYPARVGMIGDQRVHVCRHRDSLVQRVAGRKATRQVGNRRMPQSLCRAQSRSGSASCPPIAQPFCGSQRPVPRFFERSESRMSFERRFRDVRRRSARRLEDDAAGARHILCAVSTPRAIRPGNNGVCHAVVTQRSFPCRLTFASRRQCVPQASSLHGWLRRNVRLRAEHRATTMHRFAEDRGPRGIPGPYAGLADARGSNNSPRSYAYRGLPDRRVADALSSRQIGFASGGAQAHRQPIDSSAPEKGGAYLDVQARFRPQRHSVTAKQIVPIFIGRGAPFTPKHS